MGIVNALILMLDLDRAITSGFVASTDPFDATDPRLGFLLTAWMNNPIT
jgi:hypothetical protein